MPTDGFIEQRLTDPCPAYTFSGGPEWSTRVVVLANGREKRNQGWSRPKHRFTAPFQNISQEAFIVLKSAHFATRGMAYGFRFKDWTDFRAENAPLGLAPAGVTPVQLSKQYEFGAEKYDRPISKPVEGTVTVKQNGVLKAGVIDSTTGLFTPSTAWTEGAVLTWSGEFDVPVRFDTDVLSFTLDNPNALNGEVAIVELFL